MSEHRARAAHKRARPVVTPRRQAAGRSRHGAARPARGRYVGVGTGLAFGLTGILLQVDLGSAPADAHVGTADTWAQLAGALADGTPAHTVALGADISAPAGAAPLEVPSGEAIVLDLHGHTLAFAPGGVVMGHGSSLQMKDDTAGNPTPMRGYDGRGGLTAGPPPAAAQGPIPSPVPNQSPVAGPFIGPRPPVGATASSGNAQTAAQQPAAPAPAPAPEPQADKAAASESTPEHESSHVADRPQGRHRRPESGRHRSVRREHDHDDFVYHHGHRYVIRGRWVDEYEWSYWSYMA